MSLKPQTASSAAASRNDAWTCRNAIRTKKAHGKSAVGFLFLLNSETADQNRRRVDTNTIKPTKEPSIMTPEPRPH